IEKLVAQFSLSSRHIFAVSAEVQGQLATDNGGDRAGKGGTRVGASPAPTSEGVEVLVQPAMADEHEKSASMEDLAQRVWDSCRVQVRSRLDDLAQRIEPAATWNELVLPETQYQTLRDIATHVKHRTKVYETWGFASKGERGLGISTLFAGGSGTGKTMAAEVLANELRFDMYRIDLSQVVSKYIGETEKNLRRVFDAAEEGGTVLLFDEADALFGKRSEVRDSHDRYANIEVSYLLQRMEAFHGLSILTTNLKNSLDSAFLRRIRFIIHFPFPDIAQRCEIWRHTFPTNTPTEGLDEKKLARLNVTGGNIRNIALNAAFLAADADEPVRMTHLLRAARSEYAKLEKSLTDTEIGGWI
ncbi:MAG: ATP-binding protein, partial [Chloroflexota bacterium]|nr:ATP-binding protein [Chloroflexota bacterium]